MKKLVFLLVLIGAPCFAQGQNISRDNRYASYKAPVIISWPGYRPDLAQCKAGEYYEPSATNLLQYATYTKFRVQEHDECAWMLTTSGWRYVLRPAGTKVAVDAEGRDLFDLGDGEGKVCGNPRPVSFPIVPTTAAPPLSRPNPPPKVVISTPPSCLVSGNPGSGFIGTAYNGTGKWTVVGPDGGSFSPEGDRLQPPENLMPGKYTARFFVTGVARTEICERSWEVPAPTPTIKIVEGPGYCDEGNDHHFYAWPWVQIRCHPVRTAIIVGAGLCVATAIASEVENEKIMPCGWFIKHGFKITPPLGVKPII